MKKIKLSILLIFLVTVFMIIYVQFSLAQETNDSPGAFFYQANAYYQEGKYDAAIQSYKKVSDLGLESGNLYYNLGNSYFKKGELGLAILNYEKAKMLIPNDSDLKSNYDYVLQVLSLEPQFFGNGFEKIVAALFQRATVNFLTMLLFINYIILIMFFILKLFLSKMRLNFRFISWVLIALFILTAFALNRKIDYLSKTAIVISKEADVKFEPLKDATTYFKLSQGNKVQIVEKAEGWYKIRRFDNKLGWVNESSLAQIFNNP